MSNAVTTLPTRPAAATARGAMGKREKARLILTSTSGIIFTVLFVWLFVARLWKAPIVQGPVWAASLAVPDALGGAVTFQDEDARLISEAEPTAGAAGEAPLARLEKDLGGFLERKRGQPVILYLSAASGSWGDAADAKPVLLTSGEVLGESVTRLPLDDVLALVKKRGDRSDKLLVLDLGQVGPSRELGAFGTDVQARLEKLVEKDRSIAFLLACAPGQISWVSEAQGQSVFAHYLAEALDGRLGNFGGVSAGDLLGYVRPRVERWVRENRGGAIQTPVLVGSPSLRLPIASRAGISPAKRDEEADAKLRGELIEEWKQRQKLASQAVSPVRHAPIAWRRYQSELLRAERLLRASSREARLSLEIARGERAKVEQQAAGIPIPRPWSLAVAKEAKTENLRGEPEAYDKAVRRLLERLHEAPATGATPAAKQEEVNAEPIRKIDQVEAAEPKAKGDPKATEKDAGLKQAVEKAKSPASTAEDPLAILTDGSSGSGMPFYVEGQVPVWYAQFVARGGETSGLRDERIKLVALAYEVRTLAEASCGDARVAPWIQPMIARADPERRTAQDIIFSGDKGGLDRAEDGLKKAEDRYKEAARAALACSRALDLLERLQDELPYFGEWLARRKAAIDPAYLEVLEAAGRLADLAYAPPASEAAIDKARADLIGTAEALDRSYRTFKDSVDLYAARLSQTDDWRELDAILHLPMVDPARRDALLQRIGSKRLSPSFDIEPDPSDSADAPPDPAFWNQATGLAWVEASLLRLAGADDSTLWTQVTQARSSWEKSPDSALAALETATGLIHSSRRALVRSLRAREEGTGRPDPSGKLVRMADRAARVLPVSALRRIDEDPCRMREALDHRARIIREGLRLCDDFAAREARMLLSEVRTDEAQDVQKAIDLAAARSAARLNLTVGTAPAAVIQAQRVGDLPDGLAAGFVAARPGTDGSDIAVRANSDPALPSPTLLAVSAAPASPLTFQPAGRAGHPKLVLFFRGRFFTTKEDLAPARAANLVKVEIEQRYLSIPVNWRGGKKTFKMPDQFARNKNRGFLHPVNSLAYKLKITNTSNENLRLCVSHGLVGITPYSDTITVGAGKVNTEVVGSVSPGDLPADGAERLLKVRITEEDPDGPALAKDLFIPFQKIKPGEQDIGSVLVYNNGVLILDINHNPEDRVTAPALIYVKIEPFEAIRQLDHEPVILPLGEMVRYRYLLLDRTIEKVKWSLYVDEVKIKEQEEVINRAAEKPAPGGAMPQGGAPPLR